MFAVTLLFPSLKVNDSYMLANFFLFFLAAVFGLIKFGYKPMAKDIRLKYEMQRILDSNYTDDEKVKLMKELRNEK